MQNLSNFMLANNASLIVYPVPQGIPQGPNSANHKWVANVEQDDGVILINITGPTLATAIANLEIIAAATAA